MADARIPRTASLVQKLANVMVNYSLELQPGQKFWLRTTPLAEELNLAVYEEAIKAGANVFVDQRIPGADEIFFKYASDEQLDFVSPIRKILAETFDASLYIEAEHNSRSLAGIDGSRIARTRKAGAELFSKMMKRSADGSYRWCLTVYPTHAMAQDADMNLSDYREFVYNAGMLNEEDPVAFWKEQGRKQTELADWLKGHDRVVLKGSNVDITLSIKDRVFEISDGRYNFPDGEIFTSPVEDSVNGWIRFQYPALYDGQEVTDIELWFENSKVVKEKAAKNQELLTSLLNTDAGARILGEWGIGTNYGIQRFSKNMLFDEKIGGTIHFAVGAGFPECGGRNESGLHWDMLCDMTESEISVDGELFYQDGKTVIS
ncbi:MAG TPA: aminopeptidase [Anaerolineales bacterium]|nr:aminopeptidase [Anaerolineales bacterium]